MLNTERYSIFNRGDEAPKANGAEAVDEKAADNAEIAEKAGISFETSLERGQEIPARSSEEIGRSAGDRVGKFFDGLKNVGARLVDRIKGWGNSKAAKFVVGALKVGLDFTPSGDVARERLMEGAADKVSKGYVAVAERFNQGREVIGNRVEAAQQKLEARLKTAHENYRKRMARERFQKYLKALDELEAAQQKVNAFGLRLSSAY